MLKPKLFVGSKCALALILLCASVTALAAPGCYVVPETNQQYAEADGASCVNSVAIATNAQFSEGMRDGIAFDGFSQVTLTNSSSGTITTTTHQSPAILSKGSNVAISNAGLITTTGDGSAGIWSSGTGAVITNTGSITTNGAFSIGPPQYSYSDAVSIQGGNSFFLNSGSITTHGESSYGVWSTADNVSITNTGAIGAYGARALGLTGDSVELNNSGQIVSFANDSVSLGVGTSSLAGISNVFNSGTISNSGTNSYAVALSTPTAASSGYVLLTNTGIISSTQSNSVGVFVYPDSVAIIDNRGSITTGSGGAALLNAQSAIITSLTNSREIGTSNGIAYDGGGDGVRNEGSIGNFSNTSSGVILGSQRGLFNGGTITNLTNAGNIGGYFNGINNDTGSIVALNNSGFISGDGYGLSNAQGSIGSLTNIGSITGGYSGIESGLLATLGSVTNQGTISGGTYGIHVHRDSAISNSNTGVIRGTGANSYGVRAEAANITIDNYGQIIGVAGSVDLSATDSVIRNYGTLDGGVTLGSGTSLYFLGNSSSLVNGNVNGGSNGLGTVNIGDGTTPTSFVSGAGYGNTYSLAAFNVNSNANFTSSGYINAGLITLGGSMINEGLIESPITIAPSVNASFTNKAILMTQGGNAITNNSGTLSQLDNQSLIAALGDGSAIDNSGSIVTLRNRGDTGVLKGTYYGIRNNGSIGLIDNSANIYTSGGGTAAISNESNGTITTLTNSGTIGILSRSTPLVYSSIGINNSGTIGALTNASSGVIMGTDYAVFNAASGNIGAFENNGSISSPSIFAIYNDGFITTLANNGSISTVEDGAIVNTRGATIANLNNSGTVSVGYGGQAVANDGLISALTNSGNITGGDISVGIVNAGTINNLLNAGTISVGVNGSSIYNQGHIGVINNTNSLSGQLTNDAGTIETLMNSGVISSVNSGIENANGGTIGTIINTGSIYSTNSGRASILNDPALVTSIATLNNAQGVGNAHGALSYEGALPTNYNIIFNSPTSYGQLNASAFAVTGTTNFGIYTGSALTKGTYAAVLSGLTASNVSTATRSGMYNGTAWTLALGSGSTTIWDLIVQSSATNTLASVQQNSNGLATVYNQQAAAYQAALSYDCQVYDENNLCVSVGGRYTYAGPSPSSNQQAGLVILGYKPVQTFRVGAFADQSVNISTPTGFSQSKTSPMWGFFAKWHKNKDETGLGVQASAVTSASSLTATRPQLFNTEAGSGTTQFNGQGYQLTTNYHQPVTNNTSVVPYLGLRYTRINAGAYTENTTATVTSPLSYNAMAQNTFSAIAGLGVRSRLAEKLTGTASVGIQQNLNYSMGNYAGTSNITGLESFSVQMPGNVNSMATATAGMFYDINKRERVGLNVLWQQQPFIATNTTTALATYTIGF